jgi:hypothetical protein
VSWSSASSSYSIVDRDTREHGRYRGRWKEPRASGIEDLASVKLEGNPARSADIDDIMNAIKHKQVREGPDRQHSLPMSKDNMDKIFSCVQDACAEIFEMKEQVEVPTDPARKRSVVYYLCLMCFFTLSWTLWSRCVNCLDARPALLKIFMLLIVQELRDGEVAEKTYCTRLDHSPSGFIAVSRGDADRP